MGWFRWVDFVFDLMLVVCFLGLGLVGVVCFDGWVLVVGGWVWVV